MKYVLGLVSLSGLVLLSPVAHARKTKPTASPPKATIKVISQGAAPRAKLRFTLRPGKTTMRANVRMGMSMPRSKTRWIPIRMVARVTFGKRLPSGLQPYTHRVLGFRVAGKSLPAKDRLRLKKASLSGHVSPRGVTSGVKLDTKNIPAALRQGLEQYRQCMAQSFVRFPSQPLGKGGVWEVRERKELKFGGMSLWVRVVTRYRLVRRRGSALVLRTTTKTSAKPQTFKKGSTTVKVHRLQGSSRGTHRLDLTRFKPRVTMSSTSTIDIDTGIRLAITSLQKIKIRSK